MWVETESGRKWKPVGQSWPCGVGCQCGRHKPKVHSEDALRRIREARTGSHQSEEAREKSGAYWRGKTRPKETRQRMKAAARKRWQDPEYAHKVAKAVAQVCGARPNKAELRLLRLLEPKGFRYVGDGTLIVGRKCPDFWDGGTRLVELYGDYWHRGEDPQERIDYFAQYGYECQVVWECELKEMRTW